MEAELRERTRNNLKMVRDANAANVYMTRFCCIMRDGHNAKQDSLEVSSDRVYDKSDCRLCKQMRAE